MGSFSNEDEGFQLWLFQLLNTHESFRSSPTLSQFTQQFFQSIQDYHKEHGNQILYCRGQERLLVSLEEAAQRQKKGVLFARWYDFVKLSPTARQSGPVLEHAWPLPKRRFEALTIKVQASRNKGKLGMTDDTGYLFPCLQQNIPRAFFLVVDHLLTNVFIIHGNKKFAGQGDEGLEEGTLFPSTTTSTDIHAPPVKCFPGTENLSPTHYVFTWKANGKNAGVYGYTDPSTKQIWLFVNSKGVCECAGLLDEILKDPNSTDNSTESKTTFSDETKVDPMLLPPHIFQSFADIWHSGLFNQDLALSLWKQGYLFLFEFCDNKHVVLEYGKHGRPVDHLAFIGMVQLPPLGTTHTLHSGLVFRVDSQFTFDLWRQALKGPPETCKPTMFVKPKDLELATRELMKGRFFPQESSSSSTTKEIQWFDSSAVATTADTDLRFLAGEGAVCYEMAESDAGDSVIRQLFKAKTASYITHRQFRGFLQRIKDDDEPMSFHVYHREVFRFCRKKFGDLAMQPYPDPKEFCVGQDPSEVVRAAALFYAHFGMWLQEMATQVDATVAGLVGFVNVDVCVPADSAFGKEYQELASRVGLVAADIAAAHNNDDTSPALTIRCGMAFRIAEFCAKYNLDHSKVFAAPKDIIQRLVAPDFKWDKVPTGYSGTIQLGFNHVFPQGQKPNRPKEANKGKKKKQKQKTDVFGPFRKNFSVFLAANPDVKLSIGARDDDPDEFVFDSPAANYGLGGILRVSTSKEEFLSGLLGLPSLGGEKDELELDSVGSKRLRSEAAVAQAKDALQQALPSMEDLFRAPLDLKFGDVKGRLVPIICSSTTTKKMLILRGVSGVGKSTVAGALKLAWDAHQVEIVEADDYFGPTCPFHVDLLSDAHEDAQERARQALQDSSTSLVVVSNTSIMAWEYAGYLEIAMEQQSSVSIMTLDTETSLECLENLHDVPRTKVEKMAKGLRSAENNPEGKTLEQILQIASEQAAKNGRPSRGPNIAIAWTLLSAEGKAAVQNLYTRFLLHLRDEGIAVLPSTARPPNPHVTLVFVKETSTPQEFEQMAEVWSHHGTEQSIVLGEIRYSTRAVEGGPSVLMNAAVQVTSFTPNIVKVETPHLTLAYDPDQASAADSKKLWQVDASWPTGVSIMAWSAQGASIPVSGVIQSGALRNGVVDHQVPSWLTTNGTFADKFSLNDQ